MIQAIAKRGLVLVGCGFMGKALLKGWLTAGVPPSSIYVQDPSPSDWLSAQTGLQINQPLPNDPAIVVIATKPQILNKVLPSLSHFGNGQTIFVSIAAGAPIALFEEHLGVETPIVRAMPNLPATVGAGITALFANQHVNAYASRMTVVLFEVIGGVVHLRNENQLHAVTAISGSGPGYVFAMANAMQRAGEALGLPSVLAQTLAYQTISGAGLMLTQENAEAFTLQEAVTSKGGTTQAGLGVFTAKNEGIVELTLRTATAVHSRSIELSQM